jgi:anti-sigma regulatory factor (Ser/Thr protein kinase)
MADIEKVDGTKEHSEGRIVAAKFKPRARLLLQLGDQLIKNESIALIELVKNSYDADANTVDIYMESPDDRKKGLIIIHDDGFGMDLGTVLNVWLEPGSDFKSQQFKKRRLTPKYKRLPIGEKGIGRFGAHKLGYNIELSTKKVGSKEVYVSIDWRDFERHIYLEDVPIRVLERDEPLVFKSGKSGTEIVISDLRSTWDRGTAREIQRAIQALVSPFESIDSFKAKFEVIDKPAWFEGLLDWKDVKDYALFKFRAVLVGDRIKQFHYSFTPWASMTKLSGKTIDYAENAKKKNDQLDEKLIEALARLEDDKGPFSLNQCVDGGKVQKCKVGEVVFEGYIFDRDTFVLKLGVSDKTGFKKYLDSNSGVRVFRDGLRVYDYGEPENDWLDLNLRRVNQPDKKVSKNIMLGAVYLKRSESQDLIEKTNREGFIDNEAYRVFKRACTYVLEIVEDLRYRDKLRLREAYGPTRKSEPVLHVIGSLKEYVEERVKESEVKAQIIKYINKIESDYKRINENLLQAAGAGLSMSVVVHEVEKILSEVERVVKKERASERVAHLVKHLSSLIDGYAEIIRRPSTSSEDLKSVIDQALFNIEYRLGGHKIELKKGYQSFETSPKVAIARNLLIGSIINVIDNSIYWLERAAYQNEQLTKRIYVGMFRNRDTYFVVVADNGPGFLLPTEEITEPFVTAKPGGIGLGLHIASEVMTAQGGRLSFPEPNDFDMPAEFRTGAIVAFEIPASK